MVSGFVSVSCDVDPQLLTVDPYRSRPFQPPVAGS